MRRYARRRMADRRGNARTRVAAPFLAGLVALGVVACSASPSASPSAAPTVLPTPAPSVAPTETAAPPTAALTPAPSGISAAPACTAAELKASHDLVEGAAGSRLTTVVL